MSSQLSSDVEDAPTIVEAMAMLRELREDVEAEKEKRKSLEEELEAEREKRKELEETVQQFERFTGPAFAKLVNTVAQDERVPSYNENEIIPIAGAAATKIKERGDRLQSIEDTVRRHESEIEESRTLSADPQAEHWSRVVEKAQNVQNMSEHSLPDNWVILHKEDVASAIEPGKKRASQLISEWTDTDDEKFKQGTKEQPYRPPAKSRNNNPQKKGIKIDLDVWGNEQ